MKLIIAGSRHIHDVGYVIDAVRKSGVKKEDIEEEVSGGAKGIDRCGELWAMALDIPVKRFEAKWNEYGRKAGPIRNMEMANYVGTGGMLIAIPHPILDSIGTRNMIKCAEMVGVRRIFIYG